MKEVEKIFKNNIQNTTFNLNKVFDELKNNNLKEFPLQNYILELNKHYNEKISKKTLIGLIRFVFLIEPVNKDITSTKVTTRWIYSKNFFNFKDQKNSRYSSLEDCLNIFKIKFDELIILSKDKRFKELIVKSSICNSYSHEINIDYKKNLKNKNKIHTLENIVWLNDDEIESFIKLRNFIYLEKKESALKILNVARQKKIKIKSYLTDRAQTGPHQTNREKRWETDPKSVQFATKHECYMVEKKLIEQLILFKNFPVKLRSQLIDNRNDYTTCPITLNEFDFNLFQKELINPNHGQSNFHVGHLNPLKKMSEDPLDGHNQKNISWISDHGNRIQGSLSLKEVKELIKQINSNYLSKDQ